jgi:hypothetical protein
MDDNIKANIKKLSMDWIHLALKKTQWWVLVNILMKCQVLKNDRDFDKFLINHSTLLRFKVPIGVAMKVTPSTVTHTGMSLNSASFD